MPTDFKAGASPIPEMVTGLIEEKTKRRAEPAPVPEGIRNRAKARRLARAARRRRAAARKKA